MGGIMGGGKQPEQNDALAAMSQKAFKIGEPAMQEAMDAVVSALQTGGIESRVPHYQQAVEKSLQASNEAQVSMGEDFARTGIAGTPFAQDIMSSMIQQGAQQAAYLPTAMQTEDFWKILSIFFPAAGQTMGTGVSGQGTAAGVEAQRFASTQALMGQMFSAPFQGLGSMTSPIG